MASRHGATVGRRTMQASEPKARCLQLLIAHKARLAIPDRWRPGHRPRESGNPLQSRVPGFPLPAFAGTSFAGMTG